MKLRVFERIGAGGSGEIFRGMLLPERRPVAVKRLADDSPEHRRRLRAEAEVMAGLEHPNIVEIIALRDEAEELCLVLELVDGLDLGELLRHAPLSMPVALYIGRAIFEALAHAHEREVVHRDLSPANVLISRSGEVKLTDFGVAKFIGDAPTTGSALRATLPYISPEQLHAHPADPRSDLFAAGVLLYQLLTGRSPFGATGNDALRAILQSEYRSVAVDAPWLSVGLQFALQRLLAPLAQRFQTATEVLATLPEPDTGRDALAQMVMSVLLGPGRRHGIIRHLDDALPTVSAHAGPCTSRYELQKRLGRGGMGEVWRGTRRLGHGPPQTVAFKFVKDRLQHGQATIEQIEREARTAMTLHHHNIAAVYDVVEVNGRTCIVMEHVDGIDLRRLSRRISLSFNLVRCILRDVLSGLQHAHERGVLHRDLSPANIMIDCEGVARLMDFGVARNLNEVHSLGLLVGTAPFMAPETLEVEEWSRASDSYSLGAVFYEVLTGKPPYGRGDRLEVLRAMRSRVLRPLPDSVPADLRVFIMAALHRLPARRQVDYAIAALEPVGRDDRAWLAAEVRRAASDSHESESHRIAILNLPPRSRPLPGSARPQSVAPVQPFAPDGEGGPNDTEAVPAACIDAADTEPLVAMPALAGRGQRASTVSPIEPLISGNLSGQESTMDHVQRFLDQLALMVGDLPVFSVDGVVPVRHKDFPTIENDATLLFARYDALPETVKVMIEPEWHELLAIMESVNDGHHQSRNVYDRCAVKLSQRDIEEFENATTEPRLSVMRLVAENADLAPDVMAAEDGDNDADYDVPPTRESLEVMRRLYIFLYEQVYGYPPPEFADAARAERRPHLTLVPDDTDDIATLSRRAVASQAGATAGSDFGVPMIPQEQQDVPVSTKRRAAAIGGTLLAAAVAILILCMPDSTRNPTSHRTITPTTSIKELPVGEETYAICEPEATGTSISVQPVSVSVSSAPKRRKSAKVNFGDDVETIILKSEDKPTYQLTLTSLDKEKADSPSPGPEPSARTVDLDQLNEFAVELNTLEEFSVVLEVKP